MKGFYLMFAAGVFALFCFLEFNGTVFDSSSTRPAPKYYNYRGSSGGGYYGSSRSRTYYSHK